MPFIIDTIWGTIQYNSIQYNTIVYNLNHYKNLQQLVSCTSVTTTSTTTRSCHCNCCCSNRLAVVRGGHWNMQKWHNAVPHLGESGKDAEEQVVGGCWVVLLPRLPARRPSLVQEPSIIFFTSILDFSKRNPHRTKKWTHLTENSIFFHSILHCSCIFQWTYVIPEGNIHSDGSKARKNYFLSEGLIPCSSRGRAMPAHKKVTTMN